MVICLLMRKSLHPLLALRVCLCQSLLFVWSHVMKQTTLLFFIHAQPYTSAPRTYYTAMGRFIKYTTLINKMILTLINKRLFQKVYKKIQVIAYILWNCNIRLWCSSSQRASEHAQCTDGRHVHVQHNPSSVWEHWPDTRGNKTHGPVHYKYRCFMCIQLTRSLLCCNTSNPPILKSTVTSVWSTCVYITCMVFFLYFSEYDSREVFRIYWNTQLWVFLPRENVMNNAEFTIHLQLFRCENSDVGYITL